MVQKEETGTKPASCFLVDTAFRLIFHLGIVFEDATYGAEAVLPANLFTLFIGAAIVGNAHFINPYFRNAA